MGHIKVKPSLKIDVNFDINEVLKNANYSKESKSLISSYMNSEKFAEHYDNDLFLITDNSLVAAFEYLHDNKKIGLPEANPITIYYSNAVMSSYLIEDYKSICLEKAAKGKISSHAFGNFFQLAFNCIINLQTSIESFLNYILNEHKYVFYDKNNRIRKASIHDKIEIALPEITKKTFKDKYAFQYSLIKKLIVLRNEMIHLQPDKEETNAKYKLPYRKIIDFDFAETIQAVKVFLNYHKENLIEECNCGNDFYFEIMSDSNYLEEDISNLKD